MMQSGSQSPPPPNSPNSASGERAAATAVTSGERMEQLAKQIFETAFTMREDDGGA